MKTYGVVHRPLVVKVLPNRSCPSKRVAFIGRQLALFERNSPLLEVGARVEIMITRPLYATHPVDHPDAGSFNYSQLRAILARPVEPEHHRLVAIDGFEHSRMFDGEVAVGVLSDGTRQFSQEETYKEGVKRITLTPGLVRPFVAVDEWSRKPEDQLIRPTNVWIDERTAIGHSWNQVPVLGLTRTLDAAWSSIMRRPKLTLRQEQEAELAL